MHQSLNPESRTKVIFVTLSLVLVSAILVAPIFFQADAQKLRGKGLVEQTRSHDGALPNFDIRTDKASGKTVAQMRARNGKSAADVADFRDSFVKGEQALKARGGAVKVEYGPHSRSPEIIGVDVDKAQGKAALASLSGSRADTVKQFIGRNEALFGVRPDQAYRLDVAADYKNPEGGMSFVRLKQKINGVPVFGGEVNAAFGKNGSLVRVINNLAAGAAEDAPASFGNAESALQIAASSIGSDLEHISNSARITKESFVQFGEHEFAPTAQKVYFPLEPGVLVPSWSVLIWQPVNAFYIVVDAEGGNVLWRKNLTEDQTQSATYSVYTNPGSLLKAAENPAPLTPGPLDPGIGTQGNLLTRTSLVTVGNQAPYGFNSLGWLTDGQNVTDGNNVEAGPDRDCVINQSTGQCQMTTSVPAVPIPNDGIDSTVTGSAFRDFTFSYNPAPGNPGPGEAPLPDGASAGTCTVSPAAPSDSQKGAVVQLFFISNLYHDEMYRLGFTEAAGNFQNSNFGRGGLGGDRVSAQAQDCAGVNNANFSTPPDGSRGRMQMYVFSNPDPDRDGSLDADIVIHELTHGLSNRLHGNAAGLGTNMSRAMGEGWSDFYAHALLSEESDPADGIYTTGGYATYLLRNAGFTSNYYYGIRRFPKAILSAVGGPNNRPHNPLTFADIDQSQINLGDGAFAPAFIGTSADQVHAAGEVWSSMLWEVRAKYIARLDWEEGNRRILQHVTDGMKLSPLNPTFVQARDAILAAAFASGTPQDVKDIWEGFALRGLGVSASVTVPGTGVGNARVVEAFDLPNLQQPGITVSDAIGDNDGYPEAGERVRVSIPLTNQTGSLATGVSATLVGAGTRSYGSIAHNGTASNDFTFNVPANSCGTTVNLTINVTSSLGPITFNRQIRVGVPQTTFTENFDSVTAPVIPSGWTVEQVQGGTNFVNSTLGPDSAPNSMFALDPTSVGGGSNLISPSIAVTAPAAVLSFRHRYDTEAGWDGGLLEISVGGGAYQEITTAGGSFIENGYNSVLGPNPDGNSPLGGKAAWSGNSGGYITTRVALPPSAAGQSIRIKWRFGADDNTTGTGPNPGWYIDNINITGNYSCSIPAPRAVRSDFDGDRKTDVSVFRPGEGMWYVLPSNGSSFYGLRWGLNGDLLAPGDYDNDGRTDAAVYRPGHNGGNSVFYVLRSSDLTFKAAVWGLQGDIPVGGDYDGDKRADYSVYRPSERAWYVLEADGGIRGLTLGQPGDIPVAGDFDGDGKSDMTVFRNGEWITILSTGGYTTARWGLATDIPVPADYDNDGKDDYAVFRPSTGYWWIYRSTGGISAIHWGYNGDIPVPGDYDGDGKYDPAIYRGGDWWLTYSSTGTFGSVRFGLSVDKPVPKAYLP